MNVQKTHAAERYSPKGYVVAAIHCFADTEQPNGKSMRGRGRIKKILWAIKS